MALKHGDWVVWSNVYRYSEPIYEDRKSYWYDPFTKHLSIWWEKVKVGTIVIEKKLPRPSEGRAFRMDPVHNIGKCSSYSRWHHRCSLVAQAYREYRVEYSIGEDDFIFEDKRAKQRYLSSPMANWDPKWNGRIRSWKRSKIGKQWERKVKRDALSNVYI